MPLPMEICLEELHRGDAEERFVRCVALPGADPGLALDREGEIRWMPEGPGETGLCVSSDGRLVLLRSAGAASVTVERGERALEAPMGRPVVLLHGDVLRVGERRLKVHVHGETEAVVPPARIGRGALGRLARAAAAAATLALGAAGGGAAVAEGVAGSGGAAARGEAAPGLVDPQPIEVRQRPPVVAPSRVPIDCTIDRQQGSAKGPLRIHATCPRPSGLYVGLYGTLVDRKGVAVKDGAVTIKTVAKTKIVAEAKLLKRPVKGAKVRFWVVP